MLVGLYMMVGRFFIDAYLRSKTYYAVTDRRVLILSGGLLGNNLRALNPRSLPEMSISAGDDGSGTITFGSEWYSAMTGQGWGGRRRYTPPAFEAIPDARRVYTLIQQVQREEI